MKTFLNQTEVSWAWALKQRLGDPYKLHQWIWDVLPDAPDVTLDILSQKCGGADVLIATTHKSATKFISPTAVAKFNKQNPTLTIKTVGSFHDRFLILDGAELYHFGASMKDLGRQYCAITKMDAMFIPSIMQRIP